MKVILLGTNGWYSTDMGNTPCVLVDAPDCYIVFDAGDGIYKLDSYIKEDKPIHLFLSHFHLDHIFGLHILGKFKFSQKFTIYGLKGVKDALENVIRHPYSAPFSDLPFNKFVELSEGRYQKPISFECKQLMHADPCLGYRLELENKSIAYLTDTGVCDNLYALAQNADLVILECSFKEKRQTEWNWPHLSPIEAAEIAKQAKAKKLVLTHFDASVYKTKQDRKRAEEVAKKIFPNTIAGYDGLNIII